MRDVTPALGDPPRCPKATGVLFGRLFELTPPGNADVDQELRNKIAAAADRIIMETTDLFRMDHWYIARWRANSNPTALTAEGLGIPDCPTCPDLQEYATSVATHGALLMGDKVPVRFPQAPYSPIDDNDGNTSLSIW